MPKRKFRWNGALARYIDESGRIVSRQDVRDALDQALVGRRRSMLDIADQYLNKTITVREWELLMRQSIKSVHLYSAALARGGWAQMGFDDYGRIGVVIRENYRFLRKFATELEAGTVSPAQFINRVTLYMEEGRTSYHLIDEKVHRNMGMTLERNILHSGQSCNECILEAGRGWVPIGTLKPIGRRKCLSRCNCTVEYQ